MLHTDAMFAEQGGKRNLTRPRPLELLRLFLRIGAFTFGGGMAMIPLMRQELVSERHFLDDQSFVETLAVAQCAPGPIAGNIAVLLGYRLAGWAGAALSLLGVAVPAFIVITLISANYDAWRSQAWAAQAFAGVRPAVVVLIAFAAVRLGRAALSDRYAWGAFAAAAAALLLLRVHPLAVVMAAIAGSLVRLRLQGSGDEREGCGEVDTL